MIQKQIIEIMIKKKIISSENRCIYEYGLECLILKFIHYSTYIIIALYLKRLLCLLVFGIIFGALRRNAGGYHAKTKSGCYFFSCTIVTVSLLLSKVSLIENLTLIIMPISNIVIWNYAPIVNGNMDIDIIERPLLKKKIRIILLLINVFLIISYILDFKLLVNLIVQSCLLMASMLILGIVNKTYFD